MSEPTFTVTPRAREMLVREATAVSATGGPALNASVPSAALLEVAVTGRKDGNYRYAVSWREAAPEPGDLVTACEGVDVVIPAESVPLLDGACLDVADDLGPVIVNPNRPAADPLADRVEELFEQVVNPALADHGGAIELDRIADGTLYVRLSGGCQGCSSAPLTLGDGIERFIVEQVPEITKVVDITDHSAGMAPYLR